MTKKYNPYTAIKTIYDAKKAWTDADKAKDEDAKKAAAARATDAYNRLTDNGYGDVADKLHKSTYDQAKITHDYYAKTGRTKASDYLSSLGKAYGLSGDQIAGLISYDAATGEMSFGGKNVGKADAMVDGDSYWTDTGVLKSAFDDYISRSGTTRTKSAMVDQANEDLYKRMTGELDDLKKTNPFETPEGKAILAKYNLAGLQGRDNAVASGGATNGGNIDSFAAANALRQQTALVSQGQSAVLDAHNQKIDHALKILEGIGVHIDRVYEQDETSKNNQVDRDVKTAEVTGVVPTSMSYASNPFFNSDGTLKDVNTDYQAIINDAESKLKTTNNAEEKADLEATIRYAKQARIYKVQNNPAYKKWENTLSAVAPEKTEDARQFDEDIAYQDRARVTEENMNREDNATDVKVANIEAQNNLDVVDAKKKAEEDDDVYGAPAVTPYQAAYDTAKNTLASAKTVQEVAKAQAKAYQQLLDAYSSTDTNQRITEDELLDIIDELGIIIPEV